MSLKGRNAVVTGGGSGIGKGIAQKFAQLGCGVAILDVNLDAARSVVQELSAYRIPAFAFMVDVSDFEQVKNGSEEVIKAMKRIDILVNNAGVPDQVKPVVDQDISFWKNVLLVHIQGTYYCSLVFGKAMIQQCYGKIVNIASIAGFTSFPRQTAYSPAKAAGIMLTKVLAVEWAKYNINVNAVAPGFIDTVLLENMAADGYGDIDKIIKGIPVRRLGTPQDVANAVCFLASDEASYITGNTLIVDGGWMAYAHA